MQDASVDLEYGGRGVNLGYSGTPYGGETLTESVGLQGGVIGIGMDTNGLFGTESILVDGTVRTGTAISDKIPNSISLRSDQSSQYAYLDITKAITAFNINSSGTKTLRARLGNYGRTIYVDYRESADYDYINIFEENISLTFTESTRYRPGVSFVKNLTGSSASYNVIIDNFHVEGKTQTPSSTSNTFTPLSTSIFTVDDTPLGDLPQPVPEKEEAGILPFLGMKPNIGIPDTVCGLSGFRTTSDGGYLPSTTLYSISATIGTIDIAWNAVSRPIRFVLNYENENVLDSGYVGTSDYDYEGSSRKTFIDGFVNNSLTAFPDLTVAPDGYPYVDSSATIIGGIPTTNAYYLSTFYKGTDNSRITTLVYDPLSGNDWEVFVGCPYRKVDCGTEVEFSCGEDSGYPSEQIVNFNTLEPIPGRDNFALFTYDPSDKPERFIVESNSTILVDTFYVGNASYNYGGNLRTDFTNSLANRGPIPELLNLPIAPDGNPYVFTNSVSTVEIPTNESITDATVRVYSPLSPDWNYNLGCKIYVSVSVTPTPTPSISVTPSRSTGATPIATPSLTVTPTATPTNTPSRSFNTTPLTTPSPTATELLPPIPYTPPKTPSTTPPAGTPQATPTPTTTNTPSTTPTLTVTPTATSAATPPATPTNTPTNTATPTNTPSKTPSTTVTATPIPTIPVTPTNTPTNTPTPSITPSSSGT